MTVFLPDAHLWTVTDWSCRAEINGGSFSLWASPKFLQAAAKLAPSLDVECMNKYVRGLLKNSSYQSGLYEHMTFVSVGEFGLMHWNAPGNACGMDWAFNNSRPLEDGACFQSHNVDSSLQQSILMATWLNWALYVEGGMWKESQTESATPGR